VVFAVLAALVLTGWLVLRDGGAPPRSGPGAAPAGQATAGAARPAGTAPGTPSAGSSGGFVLASDSPTATATTGEPRPATVAPCADDQLAVSVAATPARPVLGGTVTFVVTIVNTSGGWCGRDLGSGAQELRVLHDGALLFSSDACGTSHTSDVRAFAAGDAVRYKFAWSSYRTIAKDCAAAAAPAQPGTYQAVARVGSKVSPAAAFEIVR
jgi:hypothetical protein